MSWISYTNYTKEERNKSLINSRWVWFIEEGNKNISLQIVSTPSFGWGVDVNGDEGSVMFQFWFILTFYMSFDRIFPEWVYAKEYNQFADKDIEHLERLGDGQKKEWTTSNNINLKGRERTNKKGWIRTTRKELSIRFHHYAMWWSIWTDSDSWSSGTPKWRSGSLDFQRLLKGNDKVTNETVFEGNDKIEMPEGIYLCKIDYKKYTKTYQRWFTTTWNRFQLEFGYEDDNGEWIKTPIPHWGKGESSWNCGMNGTYSISLSSEVSTLEEAKERVKESCMGDRKRYGSIDFNEVSGIENGVVRENLIGKF